MQELHESPWKPALAALAALLAATACAGPREWEPRELPLTPPPPELPAPVPGAVGTADAFDLVSVQPDELPAEIHVGRPFPYVLHVTNTSSVPVHASLAQEPAPAGGTESMTIRQVRILPDEGPAAGSARAVRASVETGAQVVPPSGEAAAPGATTYDLGVLLPEETRTVEVTGVPNVPGALHTGLRIRADPVLNPGTGGSGPAMELDVQAIEDSVYACEPMHVRYRVTNTGTSTLRGVEIHEDLPQGIVAPDGGSVVDFTLEPILPSVTGEQEIVLRAAQVEDGEAAPERFEPSATATAGGVEARAEGKPVQILRPRLTLAVSGTGQGVVGDRLHDHFEVENPSQAPAVEAVLRLTVPAGAADASLDPGDLAAIPEENGARRILLGTIAPGEKREVDLSFRMPAAGALQVKADLLATCVQEQTKTIDCLVAAGSPESSDASGGAKGSGEESGAAGSHASAEGRAGAAPALHLEIADKADPVTVGTDTAYVVRVKNEGDAPASSLQLSGELSVGMGFVDADGPTDVAATGQSLAFGALDALAAGETATWTIHVRPTQAGHPELRLQLQSAESTKPLTGTEPTTVQ